MPKYILEPNIVRTAIDETGSLLNVNRIPGEALNDYAERLLSTYVKRSASNYEGLLNAINRGLGLEERDVLHVDIKSLLNGADTDASVTIGINFIEDTAEFTDTIDGTIVSSSGRTLVDTNQDWELNRYVGFSLLVDGAEYEVVSNSETEINIREGSLSNLNGQVYVLKLNLSENEFNGYGLRIGDAVFKVDSNTNNKIVILTGDLSLLTPFTYKVTAFNPKVDVTASRLYLYKEYSNEDNFQLEKEIDLRGDNKYQKELIAEINSTRFFSAQDLLPIKDKSLIQSLRKQSSENIVTSEVVPATKLFSFINSSIKIDSVEFSESSIFLREVDRDDVQGIGGNYNIDYSSGSVLVANIPTGNGTVSYTWNEFPFVIKESPAIVNDFLDREAERFLFAQQELRFYDSVKEQFISSQPKADMVEYIAELIRVKPLSWGE